MAAINAMRTRFHAIAALLLVMASQQVLPIDGMRSEASSLVSAAPTRVNLIAIHPHNTSAFTEGLFFMDGDIVESTGLAQHSFIRQYRLADPTEVEAVVTISNDDDDEEEEDEEAEPSTTKTIAITKKPKAFSAGKVLKEYQFDSDIFGEGITAIGDKIFALTYKRNKVLVLQKKDFSLVATHPFHTSTGEGWGMTTDGTLLIVSDGSSSIQFYDPQQNFKKVRSIDVHLPNTKEKIDQINELEYVDGEILANVWFKTDILRINPRDGSVIETLDLSWIPAMVPNLETMPDVHARNEAVMNGIAFNPKNRHVYITGKLWDSIFELELSFMKHHRRQHHKS